MNKKFIILILIAVVIFGGIFILKISGFCGNLFNDLSCGGKWLFPLITVGALIDSINPCAFSVLLLTIGFFISVGGFRSNIFKFGAVYIIGLFLSYFLIGLGISGTFHFFSTPNFLAKIGALILIVLGLANIFKNIFPESPLKFLMKMPKASAGLISKLLKKGSLMAIFGIGVVVGFFEFPCTGGPYLVVIGLLHDYSTYLKGLIYLFYYNFIFVLPLIIILLIANNEVIVSKIQKLQREENKIIKFGPSLAMIVLGVVILLI
ncbi:hypothetical protein JW698_02370 [Candidatus Wolfebacteria bacterium]|nr:hypothetical protein [Candidatus Wolfebacteria bacterium]